MTSPRVRVAAVIIRDNRLLMVRERGRGETGRHDGLEYWTLPGGGVEPGETPEAALAREVMEEVGLVCSEPRHLFDFPYPSGLTGCYAVTVADDQDPTLGVDDLDCDCPRMVGLEWIAIPTVETDTGSIAIPVMLLAAGRGFLPGTSPR